MFLSLQWCADSGKEWKESINAPDASFNLDFIFLSRCVCGRGEIGVKATAADICKHIAMPTHWHAIHKAAQCQRVCREQLPVLLGFQASHQAAECSQAQATGLQLWTCNTPGSTNGRSIWLAPDWPTYSRSVCLYTQRVILNGKFNITVCVCVCIQYIPVSPTESFRAL